MSNLTPRQLQRKHIQNDRRNEVEINTHRQKTVAKHKEDTANEEMRCLCNIENKYKGQEMKHHLVRQPSKSKKGNSDSLYK